MIGLLVSHQSVQDYAFRAADRNLVQPVLEFKACLPDFPEQGFRVSGQETLDGDNVGRMVAEKKSVFQFQLAKQRLLLIEKLTEETTTQRINHQHSRQYDQTAKGEWLWKPV